MFKKIGVSIFFIVVFIKRHNCFPDPLHLNEDHQTKLIDHFVKYGISCVSYPLHLNEDHQTKLIDHFVKYGISCVSNHTITLEDVRALKSFEMPPGPEAACFFACILKGTNMIDESGKIDPVAVLSVLESVFEDPNELNEVVAVFQACAHVNDNKVSDGSMGCDRAKQAWSCIVEKSKMETNGRVAANDEDYGSGATVN